MNLPWNSPASLNPDDQATGTTSWTLSVAIAPGSVGGPVDSVAVTTVTLGVVGQPVPTLVPEVVLTSDEAAAQLLADQDAEAVTTPATAARAK